MQGGHKFSSLLAEAVNISSGAGLIQFPLPALLAGIDLSASSLQDAASKPEVAAACEECVSAWCNSCDGILAGSTIQQARLSISFYQDCGCAVDQRLVHVILASFAYSTASLVGWEMQRSHCSIILRSFMFRLVGSVDQPVNCSGGEAI